MERCDGCGFEYDQNEAPAAAAAIVDDAGEIARLLVAGAADAATRRDPTDWSPLELGCHVRDVLLVQRERVLAARRTETPSFDPMGRDERVDHDGYDEQDPVDVARQLDDAARMFANDLACAPADWDRTLTYNYPTSQERPLRWVAVHTVHEVRHHLADVRRQQP